MRPEYREEPCKTALNPVKGMGAFRWSLNPYMGCVHRCTYCYVRSFEQRADRPSDDRYGRSIRVKTNIAAVLRWELSRRSWKRESVGIGAATDPYQPAEGQYRLTRGCIEALAACRTPFSLITRSPMIVRDIDVLTEAARRARVSITFSVPTLDPEIWRKTEPGTAPPRQRLRALSALVDAGIQAGVAMAPLLPHLSDDPALVEDVVREARAAGATHVWAGMLHLKPGTKEHFYASLARDWPLLVRRYRALYGDYIYLEDRVTRPVRERVAELAQIYGVTGRRPEPLRPPAAPPPPRQFALALDA
jgi:DNA repair photolyase